jgi:hypothetical protein
LSGRDAVSSAPSIQPELLSLNRSGPAENDVCNATGGLSRFGADGIMREREHEAARGAGTAEEVLQHVRL